MRCPTHFAPFLFVFGVVVFAVPALAPAQPYVYPARGQSAQQQEFDRGQCYSWAVQQTGFDPANPQVYSGPPPMGWVARTLDHVGLFQPAHSFVDAVLAAKLGRGSIQITPRDLLEFVLTVWLAYLASSFIRFVLREDIYPHTRLTRGISYAISSLLNYMGVAD